MLQIEAFINFINSPNSFFLLYYIFSLSLSLKRYRRKERMKKKRGDKKKKDKGFAEIRHYL